MRMELIPHLFRTEFSKITSVLCKSFGLQNIETAEDIASDTFLAAMETWSYRGVPENPTAWLYAVARNKTKNLIAHNDVFRQKVAKTQIGAQHTDEPQIDLSPTNIHDSQLQMLFAICHPTIPQEAQVGLALRILCGFGIDEIAAAFLTNREVINKRLHRAREKLRDGNVLMVMPPPSELAVRLESVLTTLYLLFSEGYYSESHDAVLREDLCLEAMRLTGMLLEENQTQSAEVYALLALMCFHASRFKSRKDRSGAIIMYDFQNENLWDQQLIGKGAELLHKASGGERLSRYHLEAAIAYWHTVKSDSMEKWSNILQLYDKLLMIHYSPVAAMNRAYAVFKVHGRENAIAEAEKLSISGNPYYYTMMGELYKGLDNDRARIFFEEALKAATTNSDMDLIRERLDRL